MGESRKRERERKGMGERVGRMGSDVFSHSAYTL